MRRLVAVAVVVAALVAGVIAVATASLSRLVEANRERILAEVAEELGRRVRVERITVGFRRGPAIVLDGLRIGEDPAFGPEDFLTAARAYAVVRLLPLARGRIAVRRVVVVGPRATVVRTTHGTSLDSLGRRPHTARPAARSSRPFRDPHEPPAPPTTPSGLVAFVNLEDAELRVVDRRGAEPVVTTVAPISVWLSDPSLSEPIAFRAEATVAGVSPTSVKVRGRLGPIGDPPFAQDVPVSLMVGLTGAAVGTSNLTAEGRVRRDTGGRPVATVHLSAPSAWVAGIELRSIAAYVTEEGGVTTVRQLGFQTLGGTIDAHARLEHQGAEPTFAVEAALRGVDVAQALAAHAPDVAARFHGRLDADGSMAGTAGDGIIVRQTLAGKVSAAVHDGTLRGVNVADAVLSGLTGFGGLATLVPDRVRQRYPEIFASDDMRFDELRADLRIGGARVEVDSLAVTTKDYAVRGKGLVTFARRVDVDAMLVASDQLTGDVVSVLSGVRALTDDAGRLAVPFRVSGVLPDVRAKADREFVSRALGDVLVGAGLERLLGGGRRRKDGAPGQRKGERR